MAGLSKPSYPPPPKEDGLIYENGRVYHGPQYMFPAGQVESKRLDIFHQFFKAVNNDALHRPETSAEITKPNARVLDIGCGTGILTVNMAWEVRPSNGKVFGVDITMAQPDSVPPGCFFIRHNVEEPWGKTQELVEDEYDAIICRLMRGAIRNWPALFKNVHDNLKSGGVFEHAEIDWYFRKNGGQAGPALRRWAEEVGEAMDRHGMPIRVDPDLVSEQLYQAGFKAQRLQWPIGVGPWGETDHQRTIGRWFNLAASASMLPMALAPLHRIKGKSVEAIEDFVTGPAEAELTSQPGTEDIYCMLYVWVAVKP